VDPYLSVAAKWIDRGLASHDAAYAAVAEQQRISLVTDDATLVSVAGDVARRPR